MLDRSAAGSRPLAAAVAPLAALVVSLLVAAVSLRLGGHDPVRAASALIGGALGSPDALLSVTLVRSVPFILTGLAVALAFRAGVWNIGAEGQLYVGALAATWVGLGLTEVPGPLRLVLLLAASAAGGALWAAGPALLRVRRGVGEVITTLVLNFVAIDLVSWAVRGPLQEDRGVFPQSESLDRAARLAALWPGTRLHWGFVIALVLAALLRWVFARTTVGLALRAVGSAPDAARVAGRIAVEPITLGAFLASGALAGLAGGVEVAGVTYALYEGLSPGHGYTAIAVALLAGLNPVAVIPAAVLFGALEGGAGAMQRIASVPAPWVGGVEALVILSVLAVDQVGRRLRAAR